MVIAFHLPNNVFDKRKNSKAIGYFLNGKNIKTGKCYSIFEIDIN